MARSKHTDPRAVRAGRRLRSPRAKRDADAGQRVRHMPKELGITYSQEVAAQTQLIRWPRIIVRRPSPGFFHPVTQSQVLEVLEAIGPTAVYGLKSVEYSRLPAENRDSEALLGRYHPPDRIILFEQRRPPWHFIGQLGESATGVFERAGAKIQANEDGSAVTVEWPGESLANLMIFEGLLHEVGHHVLQHESRAGSRRIARTRDHEKFADMFAARCRAEFLGAGDSI